MASWGPETMQTHSTILCYLVFEGGSWPWEQMKLWLSSVFFPFWKQSSPRVSGLKWEIRNLKIHLDHPWDAGNLCRSSLVVHPSPEVSSTSWDPRWESRIWVRLWASHWKKLIPVFPCLIIIHANTSCPGQREGSYSSSIKGLFCHQNWKEWDKGTLCNTTNESHPTDKPRQLWILQALPFSSPSQIQSQFPISVTVVLL